MMFTERMQRNLIWTFGWIVAFAVSSAALAPLLHGQRGEGRTGRGGGFGLPPSALLTALDANGDGTVSQNELRAAPTALKSLDSNGDGRLAGEEIAPAGRGAGRGGRGNDDAPGDTAPTSQDELADILMSFDDSGDGRLTADELPERFRGLLERADTNKDGALTADEIRASAAGTPEPSATDGRGRGGRGRGAPGDPLLLALDVDNSGDISADELTRAAASLAALDRNADGQLTQDESRGNGGRRGGLGVGRQ